MSEEANLRDSFNRWNQTRSQNSVGFNEGARTLLSSWADSLNTSANDVYQRLPISQQDLTGTNSEEPSWFKLSRFERLTIFLASIAGSIICFTISFMLFPVLALKPRKFGLLWSLGSLLFVCAFGFLQGPVAFFKHLTSRERLPFTCFFFGSVLLTIYFAAIAKSTLLTIPCALMEFVAIVYYTVSYFPFGTTGLRMATSVGVGQLSSFVGL